MLKAGQRPINNVVDITNFVMFELGQPLHAFDLDTVQGPVVVRTARAGELLRTIDGIERNPVARQPAGSPATPVRLDSLG